MNIDLTGLSILVVDDEQDLAEIISDRLKLCGASVVMANNGTEGYETFQKHQVDLILTDIRMPGGDGMELLEKIRSDNADVPFVMFMTGYADITPEQAYDRGCSGFFRKPFDGNQLLAFIQRTTSAPDNRWAHKPESSASAQLEKKVADVGTESNFRLGRGGFFLSIGGDANLRTDQHVDFSIEFEGGPIPKIEGRGSVRWYREHGREDLPSGCGIGFEYLADHCRSSVIEYIKKNLQGVAYIPIS